MSTTKTKTAINLSRNAFANILRDINFVTMVGMFCNTEVKMNKFDKFWNVDAATGKRTKNREAIANPYFEDGVRCYAKKYKIITGFDYAKSVENRLIAEGKDVSDYKAGEVWFKQVNKCLVEHKENGRLYFRYQYLNDSTIFSEYFYQNEPIQKVAFEEFRIPASTYDNQGLDNSLHFQVVALDNIIEITLNGIIYMLHD